MGSVWSDVLPRPDRQTGAALLAALMVAALATLLATRLLAAEDDFMSLVAIERDIAQTRRLALAGMDFARAMLQDDARRSSVDHLEEPWATVVKETPAENGLLAGHLLDAQARFNVGNLLRDDGSVDTVALAAYERLLEHLGLDRPLGEALALWLRTRQQGFSGMRYWPDLGELSQVPGYSAKVTTLLRPHVVSLPVATPVNLNTATTLVLAAVADLEPALAAQAESARRSAWYRDSADFRERNREAAGDNRLWSTQSNYFEAVIEARQGLARTRLRALLHRHSGRVDVLAQHYGE